MKRVFAAYLYQTLIFVLDPSICVEEAQKKVSLEVNDYRKKDSKQYN